MAVNVHNTGDIGKMLLWIAAFVAFVVVALTWVPDWISPEGTNGTGNRGGIRPSRSAPRLGRHRTSPALDLTARPGSGIPNQPPDDHTGCRISSAGARA